MRAAARPNRFARLRSSCVLPSMRAARTPARLPQLPKLPVDSTPLPELALWGTEIGLWDWHIPEDRLLWINNWCEQAGLTDFSGQGHERLWTERMHPEDLPAYRSALAQHMDGLTAVFDVEYRLRDRKDCW